MPLFVLVQYIKLIIRSCCVHLKVPNISDTDFLLNRRYFGRFVITTPH